MEEDVTKKGSLQTLSFVTWASLELTHQNLLPKSNFSWDLTFLLILLMVLTKPD